jgi:hypothetical protein
VCLRQHPGDWKVAKDGRTAVEDWVLRKLHTNYYYYYYYISSIL